MIIEVKRKGFLLACPLPRRPEVLQAGAIASAASCDQFFDGMVLFHSGEPEIKPLEAEG